ncbi:MAG TPA: hypothetical protein VHP33_10400 [Polyangiaceae bacterium]|nr:hypothetical protein [Polyangiaceae bacterium]
MSGEPIVRWAGGDPDPAVLDGIADAMGVARASASPSDSAPAPVAGPGPQTQLAREAMSTLRSVVAVRDRATLQDQIADEIEQQTNSSFSLAGAS